MSECQNCINECRIKTLEKIANTQNTEIDKLNDKVQSIEVIVSGISVSFEHIKGTLTEIKGLILNNPTNKDMNSIKDDILEDKQRILELEKIPKKRYDVIVATIITSTISGIIGFMLSFLLGA